MSTDKRADLLMRAMDKLREDNPEKSSSWIRSKAEQYVEEKLGPDPRREAERYAGGSGLSPADRQRIVEEEKLRKQLRNRFSWSRVIWMFIIIILIGSLFSALNNMAVFRVSP